MRLRNVHATSSMTTVICIRYASLIAVLGATYGSTVIMFMHRSSLVVMLPVLLVSILLVASLASSLNLPHKQRSSSKQPFCNAPERPRTDGARKFITAICLTTPRKSVSFLLGVKKQLSAAGFVHRHLRRRSTKLLCGFLVVMTRTVVRRCCRSPAGYRIVMCS